MGKTIIALGFTLASLVPVGVLADGMPPEAQKGAPKAASAVPESPSRVTMSDLKTDAPDSYTVQKGDTLWGIAGKFLKNPWQWPQIWNMNKDRIKDPHWIYPGDVIRLDKSGEFPSLSMGGAGQSGGSAADAERNVVKLDPRIRVEPLQTAIPSIPGTAIGPFLTQPLVVDAGGLDNTPIIVANDEARVIVGAGDTTYAGGMAATDVVSWQVFRAGAALKDPESGEILGYEAKYIGDARVKRFGNPSTLEITKAREEINKGDRLMPAREISLPSYVPHAPDKLISGSIMSVDGGVSELGQYQIVTINRGSRDGIEVGHVLASFRRGTPIGSRGAASAFQWNAPSTWFKSETKPNPMVPDAPRPAGAAAPARVPVAADGSLVLPDERNGLIFVFRVFEKLSYAMVMRANRPIYIGDLVQTP
jgi:LysM repeat protein